MRKSFPDAAPALEPGTAALSAAHLAKLIDMSTRFVEKRIQEGKIQTVPCGNKRRIPPREVARILKEGLA